MWREQSSEWVAYESTVRISGGREFQIAPAKDMRKTLIAGVTPAAGIMSCPCADVLTISFHYLPCVTDHIRCTSQSLSVVAYNVIAVKPQCCCIDLTLRFVSTGVFVLRYSTAQNRRARRGLSSVVVVAVGYRRMTDCSACHHELRPSVGALLNS